MGLCHVTQRPSGPSRALCRALTDLSSGKKQDLVPQVWFPSRSLRPSALLT